LEANKKVCNFALAFNNKAFIATLSHGERDNEFFDKIYINRKTSSTRSEWLETQSLGWNKTKVLRTINFL